MFSGLLKRWHRNIRQDYSRQNGLKNGHYAVILKGTAMSEKVRLKSTEVSLILIGVILFDKTLENKEILVPLFLKH